MAYIISDNIISLCAILYVTPKNFVIESFLEGGRVNRQS